MGQETSRRIVPKHYPCVVFYGAKEWEHEGMKYGASGALCITEGDFIGLASQVFGPCYFSVRAIAYFREAP